MKRWYWLIKGECKFGEGLRQTHSRYSEREARVSWGADLVSKIEDSGSDLELQIGRQRNE